MTPLIFSTTGGCGEEADKFHKRLAQLISIKREESYSSVVTFIRRKLNFSILRSTLIAIRGYRGYKSRNTISNNSEVAINVAEWNSKLLNE